MATALQNSRRPVNAKAEEKHFDGDVAGVHPSGLSKCQHPGESGNQHPAAAVAGAVDVLEITLLLEKIVREVAVELPVVTVTGKEIGRFAQVRWNREICASAKNCGPITRASVVD